MHLNRLAAGIAVAVCLSCASASRQQAVPVDVPLPPPNKPVPVLLQELESPDQLTRSEAAWQLAGAKENQAELCSALEPLQADPERSVRYAVAWALGHLRNAEQWKALRATYETPLKIVQRTMPRYPNPAFAARVQGTVLLEVLIGEQGEVAHAEVRESIPGLDEATIACVRQWQFEPGRVDGNPRAEMALAPVTFRRLD